MALAPATPYFSFGAARVSVLPSSSALGNAAADCAAALIGDAICEHGQARMIVATGNSQIQFLEALAQRRNIDWSQVEAFHMDEYLRIGHEHPSSFRYWLRTRFEERVRPAKMHYIEGDASNVEQEIARYAGLLAQAPVDIAFVVFGENGHIAFNDPPVADFNDPAMLKLVTLDCAWREQQVGEGHFEDLDSVPRQAITITCAGLLRAAAWVCCVPEKRKAQAVQRALEGPVSQGCPASLVQRHTDSYIFLDKDSASLLANAEVKL